MAMRRRKEARPGELTAAALALFVEKGFAATRLEDVAARAGVSKGTVYLYFSSKEDLFKAVIQEGIVPVLAQGEVLVAEFEGSSAELLLTVLRRWWETIGNTELGGVPKLMISEAQNFPELAAYYHDNVIVRGRRLMATVLTRGIDSGEFRAIELDVMLDLVMAPLLMMLIWRYSLGACCPEAPLSQPGAADRLLTTHCDVLLSGLRKEAP